MKIEELKQGDKFYMFHGLSIEKAVCLYNDVRERKIGYRLLSLSRLASTTKYDSYNFDGFEQLNAKPVSNVIYPSQIPIIIYYILVFLLGIFLGKILI